MFKFIKENRPFQGKDCEWFKMTCEIGENTIIAGACISMFKSEHEALEHLKVQMLSKMEKYAKENNITL